MNGWQLKNIIPVAKICECCYNNINGIVIFNNRIKYIIKRKEHIYI